MRFGDLDVSWASPSPSAGKVTPGATQVLVKSSLGRRRRRPQRPGGRRCARRRSRRPRPGVRRCSPAVGAMVGTGSSAPTTFTGSGVWSAPTASQAARACAPGTAGRRRSSGGRVHRGQRRVVLTAELEPLEGGLRAEDVAQLGLQRGVADGVVGVLRARMGLEDSGARRPQKFFQNSRSDAMKDGRRRTRRCCSGRRPSCLRCRGAAHVVVGQVAGDLALRALCRPGRSRSAASRWRRRRRTGRSPSGGLAGGRAWTTPARMPRAPNTGPALMPIETCSGM